MKIQFFVLLALLFSTINAQINFSIKKDTIDKQLELKTVDIGDVNNDGLNDIVMGGINNYKTPNESSMFIIYQDSSGKLSSPVKMNFKSSYDELKRIQITDLNNDGLNDIVFSHGYSVGVFFQYSSGKLDTLKSFNCGNWIESFKVGDLNNDGLPDIAICHWSGGSVITVLYQDKNGEFSKKTYNCSGSTRSDIDIADINNDSLNDIILMPGFDYSLEYYYQNRNAGIENSGHVYTYPTTSFPFFNAFAVGDLNNDGKNVIVNAFGGNTANLILMYQNDKGLIDNDVKTIKSYDIPNFVGIRDLNCDGNKEIIVGHDGWAKISIYEKNTQGSYTDYVKIANGDTYNHHSVAIGDINGDMKPDIVTVDNYGIYNILINKSIPHSLSYSDTLISFSKILPNTIKKNYSYIYYTTVNSGVKRTINYYNVNISKNIIKTNYIGDSIFVRKGSECSHNFTDSIKTHFDYTLRQTIVLDSLAVLFKVDTLMTNHILNNFNDSKFQLYPNPVKNDLTINIKNEVSMNKIEILDLSGYKLISVSSGNLNKISINCSDLKPGLYLIKFCSDNEFYFSKFIKI